MMRLSPNEVTLIAHIRRALEERYSGSSFEIEARPVKNTEQDWMLLVVHGLRGVRHDRRALAPAVCPIRRSLIDARLEEQVELVENALMKQVDNHIHVKVLAS